MANYLSARVPGKITNWFSLIALLIFLPFLLFGAYETATLVSRALGKPANLVIDTKIQLEQVNTNFYHAFSQGGEEATDMLKSIQPEVTSLKPKLIRLDHLYDNYNVVSRSGSDLSFDFSRLDESVATILATGAKPVLALSYMPSVIAKDGVIINPPNDWNEWAKVVQKTIEHYSGKSDKNISGIYYEVWNEPDLEIFGKWKLSGDKNYLTLYHYASIGANAAQNVNTFYLGGPATTGLYKSWILAVVTSGYRVNFLSWHSYLANPAQFTVDERNLITWLLPYPSFVTMPKLITEFGFTGAKDKRYGTTFAAAHAAAVIRQLMSGGPTYAFSFQPKDGPGQKDGSGWGLITHDDNGKKAKPRYYVYNFMDNMAGTRLQLTGEGSWVTALASQRDNVIRVLMVNFDNAGNHVEAVPVAFNGLENGNYKFTINYLFGQDVTKTVTAANNSYSEKIYMPAESIAILQLTKI